MKTDLTSLWSRLHACATMLCMVLTLGMGVTAVQAEASVIAHIACGDSALPDGGWVCDCDPGQGNCLKHSLHGDDSQGRDMLEMQHHHHAEVPSGTLATNLDEVSPNLAVKRSVAPAEPLVLHGTDPSLTDQPPKI